MPPSDLSAEQRRAVEWAARATARLADHLLEPRERAQIAALAAIEAGLDPAAGSAQRIAYLSLRCRGAVIDAARAERRDGLLRPRSSGLVRSYADDGDDDDADPMHAIAAPDRPERREELRRVAAAVQRMPAPRPLVALRLAEGATVREIAAEVGLTPSRVSQLRREICELAWRMTDCLD